MSLKEPPGAFEGAAPKKAGSEKSFLQKKQFYFLNSSKLSHQNSQLPARNKVLVAVYCLLAVPFSAWLYNTDKNGTRGRR